MKQKSNVVRALALALVAVYGATEAKAQYVDYNIGNGGLESFTGDFNGQSLGSFLAGDIQITKTSGGAGLPNTYNTVCTDLSGTLFLTQTYGYTAPQLFSASSGLAPGWGATPAFAPNAIENAAALFYNNRSVLGGNDVSAQAGLQLAVWEALYDTGNPNAPLYVGTLAGSRFHVTGGDNTAIADANADLAALLTGPHGVGGTIPMYNYSGYLLIPDPINPPGQSDPAQELLIGAGDFTPAGAVPEPCSYAAAASAIAFIGFLTVGRKQKRG